MSFNMPEFSMPNFRLPEVKIPEPVNTPGQNLASQFHKQIVRMINDFDSTLDPSEEVGMRLVSFGQSLTFHIMDVKASDPSLITFSGLLDNGDPISLIQHVTQISFVLMAVKRKEPELPKRQIGFN